ncbi:MAG: UxaA family hydrolase [Oscillospiraceae bacterium]|nr:UxaA family hydrolase [Oscillospiraceae bacterium]
MKEYELPIAEGFLRPDGKKGIRNGLLVLYTVSCCWHIANTVTLKLREMGYEASISGNDSCFDDPIMIKRLLRLMLHPNVGAVLIVGHGCEFIQAQKLCDFAREHHKPARWFFDQSYGTAESIRHGIEEGEALLREADMCPRTDVYLRDITLSAISCAQDETVKNVSLALGEVFRMHVENGGTVLFDDLVEMEECTLSGADENAAEALACAWQKAKTARENGAVDMERTKYSFIHERLLDIPVQGILKVSRIPKKPGLWYVDTLPDEGTSRAYMPGGAGNHAMETITSGAHIVLEAVGNGSVAGAPVSPVLKITANETTAREMAEDTDLFLGGDHAAEEIIAAVIRTAKGEKTASERLGHMEGMRLTAPKQYCRKG